MATPADPYSILNKDPNRGKIIQKSKSKVNRLWPGKAPDWIASAQNSNEGKSKPKATTKEILGRKKFETEIIVETPQIIPVSITTQPEEKAEFTERERMKQELLQNEGEEDPDEFPDIPEESAPIPAAIPEIKEEDSEMDENEESEDELMETSKPLLKPMFVSKDERATVKERERKQKEKEARAEAENARREQLQIETKMMIIRTIKEENEKPKVIEDGEKGANYPDDNDEAEEAFEYEQWKIRELKRIKLDKDEREERERDRQEIERRRNLTEEQRQEENKRLGTDESERPEKLKYTFMQKYYHKGAYYQHKAKEEEAHIFNRDYNAPTAEETQDKSTLPKAMQKRRGDFGKKGNTKYTHLTAEDTTDFNPQYKVPKTIANKMLLKSAAYKATNLLNRPTRSSRK